MNRDNAEGLVASELSKAIQKHRPMHSYHEGYAVIKEEFEELWDEIKKQNPDPELLRKEAAQLGAMATRFIHDLL